MLSDYFAPHNEDVFWKLFRCMNIIPGYEIWRELHPELGERFDMCNFKEHPDFVPRLMAMDDYSGDDDDDESVDGGPGSGN